MAAPGGPPTVAERLRAASDGGFLRFDRFVEAALYGPGGFYGREEPALGTAGSFYTAPHVTPLFGAALARRLAAERARLGDPPDFRVVEVGAGDGTLALDAARALPREGPEWNWTLVERSEPARRRIAERLHKHGAGLPARFSLRGSTSGLDPFVGALVANEFLDALPFRRLVRRGTEWRELGVRWSETGGSWAEGEGPARYPGDPLPGAADGTRYDLMERAEGFVREAADLLVAGALVAIDYGAPTEELLRAHPGGTLAAVRDHRPVDALEAPGSADLSAFVDFGRLRRAAERAGFVERAYRSQTEALAAWGFAELLDRAAKGAPDPAAEVQLRLKAKNLLFGFESFHVLELEAPGPAPLTW